VAARPAAPQALKSPARQPAKQAASDEWEEF
jgi:hypothetical protein